MATIERFCDIHPTPTGPIREYTVVLRHADGRVESMCSSEVETVSKWVTERADDTYETL